ncbi:MAG: type II toxin-antitoxin system Phd/YefM family antitoxin [Propionibacteriaceae bacterium]|nr:type II toxin-antitoxin system Phd/YefM family antitoxin [Propionibacteriaceae bacterium]
MSLHELDRRSGQVVSDVIASGRPVTITDRGRPVARIVPAHDEETPFERLIREGRATSPQRRTHTPWARHSMPSGVTLEQLLKEDREEV